MLTPPICGIVIDHHFSFFRIACVQETSFPTDRSPHESQAIWRSALVLGLLYFFSGAVALAYEISWNRQIGLLFGHSERAAAIVLGAYFVGLSLGYYAGGRLSRCSAPLRDYGLAEILAAVFCVSRSGAGSHARNSRRSISRTSRL